MSVPFLITAPTLVRFLRLQSYLACLYAESVVHFIMDKLNMFLNASPILFSYARRLRASPTNTEKLLWSRLSKSQLGVRFRRQHPILSYVVDFYCHSKRIAVEIDGNIHDSAKHKTTDQIRSNDLRTFGIKVIRFRNEEVELDLDRVVNDIRREIERGSQHLDLSPPLLP